MVSMAHLHVISLAYPVTFQQASHLQVTVIDGHCYEHNMPFHLCHIESCKVNALNTSDNVKFGTHCL